jgi:hypothetical protein
MHNMARGFFSIVTTAVVAGAMGFGAGVYFVPNEKADQFRAMVHDGLGVISRVAFSKKANPESQPLESSGTQPAGEASPAEAQPDVSTAAQPGTDTPCDPNDPACAGGEPPASAAVPQAIPSNDVAAPGDLPPEPGDEPSNAADTAPSGTAPLTSTPNPESEAPAPAAPETAEQKPSVSKAKPSSGSKK